MLFEVTIKKSKLISSEVTSAESVKGRIYFREDYSEGISDPKLILLFFLWFRFFLLDRVSKLLPLQSYSYKILSLITARENC